MPHQTTFLAAIVSLYACAEFFLGRWVALRTGTRAGAAVLRNCATMLVLCGGTLGFLSWTLVIGFVIAIGLRTLLEFLLLRRRANQTFPQFIMLQVLTVGVLIVVWTLSSPIVVHNWYAVLEGKLLGGIVGLSPGRGSTRFFLCVAAYAFMFDGGSRIVRGVLDQFPALMERVASTSVSGNENRGEWIGVLERIITLTFVLTGNYSAVAFALTAKSIARFKELDDRNFAEYYLLGTSTSVAVALVAGTLVRMTY